MQYSQKLNEIETRFDELTHQMADPAVISDGEAVPQGRQGALRAGRNRRQVPRMEEAEDATTTKRAPCSTNPIRSCARWPTMKSRGWSRSWCSIEEELKVLLLPKDPLDEKNVVLEIRAGTGGDEATLFAAEVFRMYSRYAETQGWTRGSHLQPAIPPWAASRK